MDTGQKINYTLQGTIPSYQNSMLCTSQFSRPTITDRALENSLQKNLAYLIQYLKTKNGQQP